MKPVGNEVDSVNSMVLLAAVRSRFELLISAGNGLMPTLRNQGPTARCKTERGQAPQSELKPCPLFFETNEPSV